MVLPNSFYACVKFELQTYLDKISAHARLSCTVLHILPALTEGKSVKGYTLSCQSYLGKCGVKIVSGYTMCRLGVYTGVCVYRYVCEVCV